MPQKPVFDFAESQIKPLIQLGLSRIQAILYLTALRSGVLSVLELSRITKINRQQIYEEVEKLVELGLFDITRKQRRKYIPASPAKLLSVGKAKVNSAEEALIKLELMVPTLEALSIPKKGKVTVKYYEGLNKIKEAYENELEVSKNTEVLSFAGFIDHIFEFFPESYWDKWNKKFVTSKSKSRMLVHNSKAARDTAAYDKSYNRETRYLEHFSLKTNIDVFNNIVLIVSFHDEIGIWIESFVVSESYRLIFNTLWPLSKPFE